MGTRPRQKEQSALRLGIFLEGRLLEEHVFDRPQSVSIGRSRWRNDIVLAAADAPDRLELFSRRGGGFCLHLDERSSARVALSEDGHVKMLDLSKLAERGARDGGQTSIPLDGRVRGKIRVGEFTVLFHFTSPRRPPRAARLPASLRGGWVRGVHPLTAAALALSAVLQIGFLGWVLSQQWPEQLDDRLSVEDDFARILRVRAPNREAPAERPDEDESDDGEASADAGDETPSAADDGNEATAEADGEPEPAPSQPLRMSDHADEPGVLGVLTSRGDDGEGTLDQIFAAAAEHDVDEAFAGSKVHTGQLGDGKLARAGARDTGGGRTVGVGGLTRTQGARQAGNAVSTGDKLEESVECEGCRMQPLPEDFSDPSSVADPDAISKAIKRIEGRIRSCYDRKAKRYPRLAGKVVITFEIARRGSRGHVPRANASVDNVGQGVGECVAREIRKLRVPAPTDHSVTVNKAFVFERGG